MRSEIESHPQRIAAGAVAGQWPSIADAATGRQPLDDQALHLTAPFHTHSAPAPPETPQLPIRRDAVRR